MMQDQDSANVVRTISPLSVPFPYRSMLAICSDLDETADESVYLNTSEYLNTSKLTSFGPGVDLEVGNTMYFYMGTGDLSYWNSSESFRESVRELMRHGNIDCLHSLGDTAVERAQALETYEHLNDHGCHLKVWIDHAVAPSNLGPDIMRGQGDLPNANIYHADRAIEYGIRYASLGRVTSMIGQDVEASLEGIWRKSAPCVSAITALKEAAKRYRGRDVNSKYRMHADNCLLAEAELRDGQTLLEFIRCDPHPAGISVGDTAEGLADCLSSQVLDCLVRRRGKMVYYTHLGKRIDPSTGFCLASRNALQGLAQRYRNKEILVTTTKRLLDFARMYESVTVQVIEQDGVHQIHVSTDDSEIVVDGLSLRLPATDRYELFHNYQACKVRMHEQEPGWVIVHVPWERLPYALA